ncbi:MAG TPA: potassium channel family protein [Trebonia sp.]|jgi:voltage-gated potassium channel
MLKLFGLVAALVVVLGTVYGEVTPAGPWDGMYFAVVTVTTVGYGDIVPHGWAAHLVALAIMILIIPAWASVFSLLTTAMLASHVDAQTHRQTAEIKEHVSDTMGNAQAGQQ